MKLLGRARRRGAEAPNLADKLTKNVLTNSKAPLRVAVEDASLAIANPHLDMEVFKPS